MARIPKSAKSAQNVEPIAADARKRALDAALSQIEKAHGKGAILTLGDESQVIQDAIPTGAIGLDFALGIGGLPRGRVVEIYGPEASGKTTVALHCIAEAQKKGGVAVFIDAEHALDVSYAQNLGVNIHDLIVSQPDYGEQALEITEQLARSGAVDIIVIDSVAALVPRAEIDGEMGDMTVGLHARLMSQALRKLAGVLNKSHTLIIFINQLREKIGVMFGNPETTTGGRALKFYASVRLDVRRIETLKDAGQPYGARTRIKVVKNKMAPPFKEAEVEIIFGEGVSKAGSLLDTALDMDLVKRSGSWFNYGELRLAQGRENTRIYLKNNPELMEELTEKAWQKHRESIATKQTSVPAAAVTDEIPDDVDELLGLD
ncbi:MAG TPA: recombinase RecA [Clostridiaceae bacterium]|nr:recombinase RecA [Clostridiaceae bacterium]